MASMNGRICRGVMRRLQIVHVLRAAVLLCFLAPIAPLAAAQANIYILGTRSLVVAPIAGTNSDVLYVSPSNAAWSVTFNSSWLHPVVGTNLSGSGSTNILFLYDANPSATPRTGSLTIAGITVTVTQGGSNYFLASEPATVLVSSNISEPEGVAVDAAGNVYFADSAHNAIKEWISASNQVVTVLSSNLSYPEGIALDAANNIYIADNAHNAVKEWIASSKTLTNLVTSNLSNPFGVAVDASGNVYIADSGNNMIKEWNVSTKQVTTIVSNGLNYPQGLAIDIAGNLYIANWGSNSIVKWCPFTQSITVLANVGTGPEGVAVDPSGNVYYAATSFHLLQEWVAATKGIITLETNLYSPSGVAVDPSGNVVSAQWGGSDIRELPQAYVDATPISISSSATVVSKPAVLPATQNFLFLFKPAFDQPWAHMVGYKNGISTYVIDPNYTPNSRITYLTGAGDIGSLAQYGATNGNATNGGPLAGGFTFSSVGNAMLSASYAPANNQITAYNPGINFGVQIPLPVGIGGGGCQTNIFTNFGVEWMPTDPDPLYLFPLQNGDSVIVETYNNAGWFATMQVQKESSYCQVYGNFANEPGGVTVELFSGTHLLASTTVSGGQPICYAWTNAADSSQVHLSAVAFELYYGWYHEAVWTPRPVSFSTGGMQYQNCDGVVVFPAGVAENCNPVTSVSIQGDGNDMSSITVTNVAVAPLWLTYTPANNGEIINFSWYGFGPLQCTPDLTQPWTDTATTTDAAFDFFYRVRQPVGDLPGFVGNMPHF